MGRGWEAGRIGLGKGEGGLRGERGKCSRTMTRARGESEGIDTYLQ